MTIMKWIHDPNGIHMESLHDNEMDIKHETLYIYMYTNLNENNGIVVIFS